MSIIESRYEVEAQSESFATIAIRASQDTESLEPTDDVFGHNTLARQLPIGSLLLRREWMMPAFFVWRATVVMMLIDSFVTAIAQAAGLWLQRQAARFEECKVMHFTFGKGGCQQAMRAGLHYELSLAGVALLLAAVMPLLFF